MNIDKYIYRKSRLSEKEIDLIKKDINKYIENYYKLWSDEGQEQLREGLLYSFMRERELEKLLGIIEYNRLKKEQEELNNKLL